MAIDFSAKRQVYNKDELLEQNLIEQGFAQNPYGLLQQWVDDAIKIQHGEPYAFSLATCGMDHRPSVRTLLMRKIALSGDEIVCEFYSNYDSQKGQDLAQNPYAEALFFWSDLERQLRISGWIERLDKVQSKAYFHSRPKDSQLAAWVSRPQSGVVADRATMEQTFAKLTEQFGDDVPLPTFWGGYRLIAERIEFWQGRANRMHDRICYQKSDHQNKANWYYERLLP